MTGAVNLIRTAISPAAEGVRSSDARAAHTRAPIIDAEPVQDYASQDQAARAYRVTRDAGSREYQLPARNFRPKQREAETTSSGFAAQRIAQEELSDGLYFENFRPALAAYSAVDTNFVHVRRPPQSNFVIWA